MSDQRSLPLEFMAAYHFDPVHRCWIPNDEIGVFAYSDGEDVERRLLQVVRSVSDLSSVSAELVRHITDWPSKYHFSPLRGNLLRPFSDLFRGRVLEVGAGCGAITRFLGECGGEIVAVEGSVARGTIAAARCRDLHNVNVIVDAFDRLPPNPVYDVVTLVGVLEYARKYFPAQVGDPVDALIRHARAFLKPDGILIVAIENQLGLKYFAGCGEDHVGVPMFGIEDRYDANGVVTFGRRDLQARLVRGGLPVQSWWYPFPDYKLPTVVVAEDILTGDTGPELDALVGPSLESDPQLPRSPLFMLERVWKPVVRNGLGAQLANSFLVLAGARERATTLKGMGVAYHFAVERKPEYAKTVVFSTDVDARLQVRQERLFRNRVANDRVPLQMADDIQDVFVKGQLWSQKLKNILTADGWSQADLNVWAERWYSALLYHAGLQGLRGQLPGSQLVPGTLLDAVPRNLIVTPDGEAVFIDQEWSVQLPLELGFVVFRGVYLALLSVGKVAPPAAGTPIRVVFLFMEIARSLGLWIVETDLARYSGFESDIQSWVSDRPPVCLNDVLSFSLDVRPSLDLERSRDERLADIVNELQRREVELAGLVAELNSVRERNAALDCELASERQQHAVEKAALGGELDSVRARNAALDCDLAGERQQHAVEKAALVEGLSGVRERNAVLRDDLNRQRQLNGDLQVAIAERDAMIHELEDQLAAANRGRDEQDLKINALMQSVTELNETIGGIVTHNKGLLRSAENYRNELTTLSNWAAHMNERPLYYALQKHSYQLARRVFRSLPLSISKKQELRSSVLALTRSVRRVRTRTSAGAEGDSLAANGLTMANFPTGLERDVLVFSVIDWHFRIQRPQHLARGFARAGRRVFFLSNHFIDSSEPGYEVEPLDPSLALFQVKLHVRGAPAIYFAPPTAEADAMLQQSISRLLMDFGIESIVSLVQHAYWYPLARRLPNSLCVYDCMDHHEGFGNVPEKLIEIEKEMLAHSDLVVVTSSWLEGFGRQYNPNVAVVRNAGEYDHFSCAPASIYADPQGRRIIGYYGAIAEWFDLELVRAVASSYPDCLILLVGNDTVSAQDALADLPNVVFTGEIPYGRLPFYLYGFDVCLLPFKVIPLTLATNPVKVYEYLAAGKPVVCVDLPEISQFGDKVWRASSVDDFVRYIGVAMGPDGLNDESARLRKAFAAEQTWDHRITELSVALVETPLPRVSVIILTYNNLDLTKACLESVVKRSDYPNLEILVVDNASTDDTPAFLTEFAKGHPSARVILNDTNLGFAAGNNIGLAAATGDYLVVLNNDTVVTSGWVLTLLRHLQRDQNIGLIGPVTNNIGNEARVETAYSDVGAMPDEARALTLRNMGRIYSLRTAAFFCVMMPRSTYEICGPISGDYGRGFFEDDDYCRMVEAAGLRIVCADDVFVHHHLSASFSKLKDDERKRLFDTNKAVYEKKWGAWVPHVYRAHEG